MRSVRWAGSWAVDGSRGLSTKSTRLPGERQVSILFRISDGLAGHGNDRPGWTRCRRRSFSKAVIHAVETSWPARLQRPHLEEMGPNYWQMTRDLTERHVIRAAHRSSFVQHEARASSTRMSTIATS